VEVKRLAGKGREVRTSGEEEGKLAVEVWARTKSPNRESEGFACKGRKVKTRG